MLRHDCGCGRRRRFRDEGFGIRVRFRTVPVALQPRDDRSCLGVRGLGLCGALRRPGLARGDGGLLLALKGAVDGGEVGFELAPPLRRGLWFVFGLGVPLSGCLLRELAPLQLGPGFPGCFPPAAGAGGPCLVAGVRGSRKRGQPRSVAAYAVAPVALAVVVDRVVAVIRRHVLADQQPSAWTTADRTAAAAARIGVVVLLYVLRFALAAQVADLRGQIRALNERLDQAGLHADLNLAAQFDQLAQTVRPPRRPASREPPRE
jgi:hypothetical protein